MVSRLLLAVVVVAGYAVGLSGATDHIVGANRGWNPNINYTLWSGNQTFFVGDLISFRYQEGTHNVYEVSEAGYDNCTVDGAAGKWTSGKDFIPLAEPRRYFFICGNGGCHAGMRVNITVYPTPGNATGLPSNVTGFDHWPEIMPDCSPDCDTTAAASLTAAAAWLTVVALAVATIAAIA